MICKFFVASLSNLINTRRFYHMDYLNKIISLIPVPSEDFHKGEMGKICIVGGSREYTGAPFFAAISALKLGADMAHVICPPEAACVIKTYSPELMVHPLLDKKKAMEEITQVIEKVHVLIVGPGLGRDKDNITMAIRTIEIAKDMNKPIVIDADGLFAVTNNIDVIVGYRKAMLTPNANEFKRLYSKIIKEAPDFNASVEDVKEAAKKLGGVSICRKGKNDVISNGTDVLICDHKGSPRRCGGQGDLLSGTTGVFIYWFLWQNHELSFNEKQCENKYSGKNNEISTILLAAYAACTLIREANHLAYEKKELSTLTTDMIEEIYNAKDVLFRK